MMSDLTFWWGWVAGIGSALVVQLVVIFWPKGGTTTLTGPL